MNKREKKKPFFVISIYHKVFLLFLAIFILITVFSFRYYGSLASTLREETDQYLQEISRRIGENIDRIVEDNYDVLHTMANSLSYSGITQFEEAKKMLQKQKEDLNYESIFLIDASGEAYSLDSSKTFLKLDKEVRKGLLSGRETMSTTQIIDNKEYILFSVPLNDVPLDDKVMVALAASYAPSSFDKVLSMSAFNDRAYSQIITTTGAVVVRSTSPYAFKSGYNIFATLENALMSEDMKLEEVKKDLENSETGRISFELEGKQNYMVYTPVSPEDWYLLSFIPVEVVNEKSNLLLRSTLFLCGLITIAFAALSTTLVYTFNNHKRKLEEIAFVDEVTGGNTIQRFYRLAEEKIAAHGNVCYALVYTNAVKFKVLNDEIGRINCDAILRFFNRFISSKLSEKECIGRQTADNFCMLIEFTDEAEILEKFGRWHLEAEELVAEEKSVWNLPIMEFGIYVIEGNELSFPQMIDRAKLALRETPRAVDSKLRCAFYDDAVRRQLLREKQLEDRMEMALERGEFTVFLQPKYRLPEEKIGGAEALVRWKSVSEGMIYPDEFIPLFEKNGFIIQVDLFVFDKVCATIQKWGEHGVKPIKISVNCSRLHFKDKNFLFEYTRIANKYKMDRSLIEIEITESMVLENSSRLIGIIRDIKAAGFSCSMDDFGSGYSSLNLIQMIPVDVLKIDKIFFHGDGVDLQRTKAVVSNIISMAKALSMETVAEGVEEKEQVEMLKQAGCDYIQGYVFARPMEISAFEILTYHMEIS